MIKFRPATEKDALEFYQKRPPYSFKGYVAEKNGKVIGIGGIFNMEKKLVAFSDMKPEMRKHRKAIAKGCRMIMRLVEASNRPVYAVANRDEPTSEYLLSKLGFCPTGIVGELGETLVWEK